MGKTLADIEAVCKYAVQINEENLRKLLLDNVDTVFGKKYGFLQMKNVQDYISRVPLAEYSDFEPYVERMLAGEKNVLTSYPLCGCCLTSGTEGGRKYIPISCEAFARYSDYIEHYKNKIHKEVKGKRLFINCFRIPAVCGGKRVNLLSEIYYQYLFSSQCLSFENYAGGEELLFNQDRGDVLYAKIWAAFCSDDITILESIFFYDQLLFFQRMQDNWQEILGHIRAGYIPDYVGLSERVRTFLISMPVDEERLRKVEEECRKGFDGIALRLFPSLALSSGIGNSAFYVEESRLRQYLGEVPVHYFCYVASECHMGVALEPDDCCFVILPESAFYEYLPWDEDCAETSQDAMTTFLPQEVEVGKTYEIVITNFSGLYRYRIGDVVKVRGFFGESPVIEFLFRKNQMLNIAGEKTGSLQVEQAIRELKEDYGLPVAEYCVAELADRYPARYGCVISCVSPFPDAQEELLSDWLDTALKKRSVDYEDIRDLGFLDKPEILLLQPEDFHLFLKENAISQGHNKPHHIANAFKKEVWKKWRNI